MTIKGRKLIRLPVVEGSWAYAFEIKKSMFVLSFIPWDFPNNIFSMSEMAEANNIKVVISSVLPVYDYPWKPGLAPAAKIVNLNRMLKKYAKKNGHVYLDYFKKMADNRDGLPLGLSSDGVHPNKDGYAIMAPLAEKAIQKALK